MFTVSPRPHVMLALFVTDTVLNVCLKQNFLSHKVTSMNAIWTVGLEG